MLVRLKQILLSQYIGAIAIGFVAAQGVLALVSLSLVPINWALFDRYRTMSIRNPFMRQNLVPPAIHAALDFLVVFLLIRWLYCAPDSSKNDGGGGANEEPAFQ